MYVVALMLKEREFEKKHVEGDRVSNEAHNGQYKYVVDLELVEQLIQINNMAWVHFPEMFKINAVAFKLSLT